MNQRTDNLPQSTDEKAIILSIVVPTRNRARYAEACIRNVLGIRSPRLQLVLQDNSDDDALEVYVDSINDARVLYSHTKDRLDVIQNFERAMALAAGEYVCFIGDDDGVNPEIVDAALWAKRQGFDALASTRPAQYNWPDVAFRTYGRRFSGMLSIRSFTGTVTFPDAEDEMCKCVTAAGSNYLSSSLPKLYYGIVKRSCAEQVKQVTGTYFPGPSPDVAGAIAIASYVKRMAKVDYPLFLPGCSKASTGGWGAMGRHIGRLEDFPHLPQYYVQNWSNLVPRFFSGSTIWGEDIVQALRATGRDDILRDFNVPLLHAKCAVFNPGHLAVTMRSLYRALGAMQRGYVAGTLQFVCSYFYTWGLRAWFLAMNLVGMLARDRSYTARSVTSIEEAAKLLVKYLREEGRQFDPNRCANDQIEGH